MPRSILILTALLIITGGCRSPRYNVEDQPAAEGEPVAAQPEQAPLVEPVDIPTGAERPRARVSPPWVAVSDWAHANDLQPPQRVSMSAQPVFEVGTAKGTFAFQTGTRQAQFDGMTLMLGFEPTVFAGEPCLHELDIQRNLEPILLCKPVDMAEQRLIVIDPGHGGSNTGTRSADGDLEKIYTLDWALRLRPLLETNGWAVRLTRTNDSQLTLTERVEFADAVGADVFISLHFNASGGGTYQAGLETYCLTPQGMPSNLTRGFEDDLTVAHPNNTFDTENLLLAVDLHQSLLKVNGGEDRGIRRARFMGVLRGQNRPAVLLEAGFLSNPTEAAKIDDPDYRQELAEAVAAGLGFTVGIDE